MVAIRPKFAIMRRTEGHSGYGRLVFSRKMDHGTSPRVVATIQNWRSPTEKVSPDGPSEPRAEMELEILKREKLVADGSEKAAFA